MAAHRVQNLFQNMEAWPGIPIVDMAPLWGERKMNGRIHNMCSVFLEIKRQPVGVNTAGSELARRILPSIKKKRGNLCKAICRKH